MVRDTNVPALINLEYLSSFSLRIAYTQFDKSLAQKDHWTSQIGGYAAFSIFNCSQVRRCDNSKHLEKSSRLFVTCLSKVRS